MTDVELKAVLTALEVDLPGVIAFTEQAAQACVSNGGAFTSTVRTIEQMGSRARWGELVGHLARLYASPFRAFPQEMLRRQGLSVGFVNCCMLVVQAGEMSTALLYDTQVGSQLTPDC